MVIPKRRDDGITFVELHVIVDNANMFLRSAVCERRCNHENCTWAASCNGHVMRLILSTYLPLFS